jgi:DNA-binding transcriptional MerR regulator
MTNSLKTVDLARAVGLSQQQVRNYELWGFLPPVARSRAGYRLYTPRHLEALLTARSMIRGYGWQPARAIMRAVHEGDLDAALALVDARHAELDRKRRQVEATLATLRTLASQPVTWLRVRRSRGLRVGEAAMRAGVRVSAVRYWEQRGLLKPVRDQSSRYRLYDEQQLHRLQVIVLLREVGYGFDTITAVLEEMASGRPEKALEAVERRRAELGRASRDGIEATVTFWRYASGIAVRQDRH